MFVALFMVVTEKFTMCPNNYSGHYIYMFKWVKGWFPQLLKMSKHRLLTILTSCTKLQEASMNATKFPDAANRTI